MVIFNCLLTSVVWIYPEGNELKYVTFLFDGPPKQSTLISMWNEQTQYSIMMVEYLASLLTETSDAQVQIPIWPRGFSIMFHDK